MKLSCFLLRNISKKARGTESCSHLDKLLTRYWTCRHGHSCRLLAFWGIVLAVSSFTAAQSCVGRCGAGVDSSQPCQCNTACLSYSDCCLDYMATCVTGQTCSVFNDMTEYLWTNDNHRLTTSQFTANWQTQVASSSTTDQSTSKFFTYVDETTLNSRAIYTAFVAILDNFYALTGTSDSITTAEQAEMDKLYSLLTPTALFNKLYSYLKCRGKISSVTDFKTKFYLLWFNLYPRSSSKPNVLDSCGFEHVIVLLSHLDNAVQVLHLRGRGFVKLSPHIHRLSGSLKQLQPAQGKTDSITDAEQQEIDTLYSLLTSTVIFKELYSYLKCRGHVSSVEDFENKFYSLWFNLYPRSKSKPNILDSCGFEHVMVGELSSSSSISGLHNWIQFYREEAAGRLNYYGYVRRVQVGFTWNPASTRSKAVKNLGSFFIATSPQFDLALYTLCAFEFTDAICKVRLGGQTYAIQTWDIAHVSGLQIGSAYPSI
ncbi:poly(U)-specific endoribonuclease-like [Pomacea canaliculata]|uniref:poly(U)-specific endoribonuclease-like n=1 Tax=Pomacea canaliculata TaxID=400727 RepID=UPI000D729A5D|nr:poly(U)-specific endoribonuclease-like [Pomacea canaliculata]